LRSTKAHGRSPIDATTPKRWRGEDVNLGVISSVCAGALNLCLFCVFVVRSTWSRVASALRPPAGMYLRIHFTWQT